MTGVKKCKPTARQRKAAKKLAKGKPARKALREAGFSDAIADHHAKRTIERPGMQVALAEAFEAAGITKERIAEVLEKGLSATKVISANVIAQSGEGMKDANSMTKDFIEVEDYPERRKTTETISKLQGWVPSEKSELAITGDVQVSVVKFSSRKAKD